MFCGKGCQPEYGWCGEPLKYNADTDNDNDTDIDDSASDTSEPLDVFGPILPRVDHHGSHGSGPVGPVFGPVPPGPDHPQCHEVGSTAARSIRHIRDRNMKDEIESDRCGPANGNKICSNDKCCSVSGYCVSLSLCSLVPSRTLSNPFTVTVY